MMRDQLEEEQEVETTEIETAKFNSKPSFKSYRTLK